MLGETVTVRLARVLVLNVRRVRQNQRTELLGRRGAEDPAAKPGRNQPRQIPAVIEVRMGQDDGVDRGRVDRQRLPVAQPQFLQPLKQAAVDQHAPAIDLEEVLRAGHRTSGAEESQRKMWQGLESEDIGSDACRPCDIRRHQRFPSDTAKDH